MARSARDLIVRFLADVRGFTQGTDDMADALHDVARDEERLADAGEDSARRLARAYDRAADSIVRDQRRAQKDVRDGFADTSREVGDEFAENVGEAFRNGDYVGALQETFTSLTPALGAVGLGVGAAIGVGAGLVKDILDRQQAIKDAASQLFQAMREGFVEEADRESLLLAAMGTEDPAEAYRELSAMAKRLGVDVSDLFAEVVSGGSAKTAIDDFERRVNEGIEAQARARQAPDPDLLARWKEYSDRVGFVRESIELANDALRTQQTIVRSIPASYYTSTGVGSGQGIPDYVSGGRS